MFLVIVSGRLGALDKLCNCSEIENEKVMIASQVLAAMTCFIFILMIFRFVRKCHKIL